MCSRTVTSAGTFGALILLAPFLFSQTNAADAGKTRPASVGEEEVADHRAGDPPFLRISLPPREAGELAMEGIAVRVAVDSSGAVISALSDENASAELRSRAAAVVRNLRYRPFQRGGHNVAAAFEERVRVLPPELIPKTRVPFPTVHDWNSVRITLTRTRCYGMCPSYRVEIHGDGKVLYEGQGFVAVMGSHRGSIPKESVVELVNAFHDADYYSLQGEYVWGATDLPTYETSIEIDGRLKKVKDYAGWQIGMPLAVSKLESEIDRLADTDRWTRGNQNTAKSLSEEKWDFKTPEAAETLARVAQSENADAVRNLVAAGVPLDANSKDTAIALFQAASRGDVTMLNALLEAGAGKDPNAINAALVTAASGGRAEAVRWLIDRGASPNSTDYSGKTLLMAAAASGVPAVVEQALSFNPDVNARDAQGRTALMEAVGQLHYGAEREEVNRAEVVRLLADHGADPNLQDEKQNTALIECGWDADAALMLIKRGANVNAQNNDGITPLIDTPVEDVARVLIENGADLSLRDKQGKTALEEAKQSGMKGKAAAIEAAQKHKQ